MNKAAIRFFGAGLFLAGTAFQVQHIIDDGETTSSNRVSHQSYEQAQQELTNVKSQLAQLQIDLENAQKQAPQETESTKRAEVDEKPTDVSAPEKSTVLIIQSGMTSKDISTTLESAGIIRNKLDFEDYLTAQNLSGKIQIGEYDLNSTMTIKQIAEKITRQ
ncbi:endolytic transglycosylase MltG [Bacillus sp. FJAT-22090]|uniref:endolytic transglycosylase MltG n=1 Tax=Bacillus sp. FJAT-22090 TaxID=1581038 RepID=UPI00119E849A|nr:endolytic transglycosylase MltG [Bacillus sp. FJAT-22090]